MVFQDAALYPHLSVAANLAFGPRARGVRGAELRGRVERAAGRLGIADLLGRMPATLSGGQRQRVALGRALAREPAILLLDEPFSALDAPLRSALRDDLVAIHRGLGCTSVFVTHDQGEALALGDRVVVMERGRVVQDGTPADIYDRPASRFVAGFVGSPPMNLLPCEVSAAEPGTLRVNPLGLDAGWAVSAADAWAGPLLRRGPGPVEMGIRAEDLAVGSGPGAWTSDASVLRVEPAGHESIVSVALGPHRPAIRVPARAGLRPGDTLRIGLDPARASWFDAATGRRLE